MLADIQHVIIYLHGKLHLWQKASLGCFEEIDQAETPALMDPYILRKTLIHLHVEIHLILNALYEGNLSLKTAYTELERISMALKAISDFQETDLCQDMIQLMRDAIYKARQSIDIDEIAALKQKYFQEISPIVQRYTKEAAHIQLEGLNVIVNHWSEDHTIHLPASRVIVVGAKGPRQGMIEVQYFENLYYQNMQMNEEYVRYAESPAASISNIQIPDLIDELAKHDLNQWVGQEMLGDKNAMNKDVLAEFASEYLDNLSKETDMPERCCPFRHK